MMEISKSGSSVYDIILVFAFSRVHNHYLNIVKYLSVEYRIGIYVVDAQKRGSSSGTQQMLKVEKTDELFLTCLGSLGADILREGSYVCSLLVLPQANLHPDFVKHVDKKIRRLNTVSLQTFGYGTQMLKEFSEIGVRKFFVYDKTIFENKLHTEEEYAFVRGNFEIIEMGCPYRKYPVFEDVDIDYIIAYPTAMLIKNLSHRNRLLKNILRLIDSIDHNDKLVLKLHNVRDGGNRIFRSFRTFDQGHRMQQISAEAVGLLSLSANRIIGERKLVASMMNLSNDFLNSLIEKRTIALSALTPYYNFGVEVFLPFVKKGIITGISSTIWYGLYNRIAVYNCDDQRFSEEGILNSDTYKSFYIEPCGGRLKFNPDNFKKVPDSARDGDLLALIKENS